MTDNQTGFPPIEDYGLIGNCHAAALICSRGSIDWLCLPRFDSPSVFARILDRERGGAWWMAPRCPFQTSRRYLDETNVLETIFICDNGRARLLDFMDVTVAGAATDQPAPGALIRIVEGVDGEIELESVCVPRPDYAVSLPEFDISGREMQFDRFIISGPTTWDIDLERHELSCQVTLCPGERVAFWLCAQDISDTRPAEPFAALAGTIAFWHDWAARCTCAGPYHDAVVRSALALKLLHDAPSGAIVAAPTTSLPEEIGGERNWDYRFTWIRDASFTLYAMLLAGYMETDDSFFSWLVRTVNLEEIDLRALYSISPEGQVIEQTLDHLRGYRDSRPVRIGNSAADQLQLDIYGDVLDALYFAWQIGQFNPTTVWKHFRPLVDWAAANWRRPGNGIWEMRGGLRHFVHSKVMLWVALDRGIKIAEGVGLEGDTPRWRQERDLIWADVMRHGWSERLGAFKQSYEDERLDAANLVLPIVGFIAGDDPRMIATLDATLDQLVVGGLCYRYLDAPDGLRGHEATFVLCTFWLIDALILAGRHCQAQDLFEQALKRATSLGLYAEEIDPSSGAHLGNFPQAFSHIGLINAAVSLAHVGQAGSVKPEHAEAARAIGTGGGGAQE
jgi:GH15 family glucan-1,4-alpha-glucosidase